MARGENARQKSNREFWGKREGAHKQMSGHRRSHRPGTNDWIKAQTHRLERKFAKRDLLARVREHGWDVEDDWEAAYVDWEEAWAEEIGWDDDTDRYPDEDDWYDPWVGYYDPWLDYDEAA